MRLICRWIMLSPLMADGVTFPDAKAMAKFLQKTGYQVVPDGNPDLTLTLTLQTRTEPYVIHLRYAGGNDLQCDR